MPIYEYECSTCHQNYDLLQKMSDAPVTLCPNCHNNTAHRLVSAAGFQLKGTGWYATDFKNKPKAESASSKTETKAESKSSDTKKPAGKTE